jgi:hypothetical protein
MHHFVVAQLLQLLVQPALRTESILEEVGVVLGEVAVEVLQDIEIDNPDLISVLLLLLLPEELHLHHLSGLSLDQLLKFFRIPRPRRVSFECGRNLLKIVDDHGIPLLCIAGIFVIESFIEFLLLKPKGHLGLIAVVLELLVVLNRREHVISLPFCLPPLVLANLLLVELDVDDVLHVGSVVQLGAGELEVVELSLAEFARKDLEFIRNIADFVTEEAEELVVHVTLPEDLDKAVVLHLVEDRKLERFDLIERPYLRDKVQSSEEGSFARLDLDEVNDFIIEVATVLLADVPDLPLLEDHEVEVSIDVSDDLLGVRDPDLEMLGEVVDRPVEQVLEEDQLLENLVIGLTQVADPQGLGEFVHKLLVLLVVEDLLEVG